MKGDRRPALAHFYQSHPGSPEEETTMAKTSPNLSRAIDAFGDICAQIAKLEAQKKTLRNILIDAVDGAAEGEMFRVTVSVTERETLDMEAVRAKLSPQFISAHTRVTEVVTVSAKARNNLNLAA
jgi:hypothetical protein